MEKYAQLSDSLAVSEALSTLPPGASIAIDPDIADFMGAFAEEALDNADLLDDVFLAIDNCGEVYYGG